MSQQREAIDTYLLRVLHTLLMERSVTRAAVKLNQSQPAISAALRRLRDITGDPLLVRGKSGMVEATGTALLAAGKMAAGRRRCSPGASRSSATPAAPC